MIGKVFDRIQAIRPVATKTERKLIDRICEIDKKDLIYLSITDLADMLGVAEATILRFCRKLEFKGFQDFKLHLSQDMVTENEEVQGIPQSIAEQMTGAIKETCEQIDYQQCLKIADMIIGSRKVCAFAVGNSTIAAHEAKNRLLKAGINLENSCDVHNQAIITANLSQQDLLIFGQRERQHEGYHTPRGDREGKRHADRCHHKLFEIAAGEVCGLSFAFLPQGGGVRGRFSGDGRGTVVYHRRALHRRVRTARQRVEEKVHQGEHRRFR